MKRKRKSYKNTYYNITINNNYYNVEKNTKETEDINNEETANILTILMLIIYSISYTIRTIFYNNDNTKKRKMKN